MHSIRAKTIILNIVGVFVATLAATIIAGVSIAKIGHHNSEQTLSLLCQTGKSNLNYYFKSVEQSVKTVSSLIDADLDTIDEADFDTTFSRHVEQARWLFAEAAENTNGVLTYYYRIDPEISATTGELGFWYTNLDGKGFKEHEVTDISDDQFECVWFYKPKETLQPVWLPPYLTDNLDVYVLSYNVPVMRNDAFLGVVGIEISYKTMGSEIADIKVLNSGYAFIVDESIGTIIYHPYLDILSIPELDRPSVPLGLLEGILKDEHHVEYVYDGVSKHAYWQRLGNGMSIVVAVPTSEVNESWMPMIPYIVIIGALILIIFGVLSIILTQRITKPLRELTKAAEDINNGNYNVKLDYKENDEIGTLTKTVNRLVQHLGGYIEDLNHLAYADALTSVSNKSAFDLAMQDLQAKVDADRDNAAFAIAVMDCDNLKSINDSYGHDKGNAYLLASSMLMSNVFAGSIVYRIGGDEFAVILEGENFNARHELRDRFIEKSEEICAFAKEPWEKIRVSIGIAAFDKEVDKTAQDVFVHADHRMYANKRDRKKAMK